MLGLNEKSLFEDFINGEKTFDDFYRETQTSSSFSSITPVSPYKKDEDEDNLTS